VVQLSNCIHAQQQLFLSRSLLLVVQMSKYIQAVYIQPKVVADELYDDARLKILHLENRRLEYISLP
jgi:hypothetical protein